MASDRDTLAALPGMVVHDDELHHAIDQSLAGLYTDWGLSEGLPAPVTVAVHIERDLRAAGWRPPAQVITDPDTPDTYPAGSVAIDRDGDAWQAEADIGVECWACGADVRSLGVLVDAYGPITIVYVPTEEAGRG